LWKQNLNGLGMVFASLGSLVPLREQTEERHKEEEECWVVQKIIAETGSSLFLEQCTRTKRRRPQSEHHRHCHQPPKSFVENAGERLL
jgi:hypothetical protein